MAEPWILELRAGDTWRLLNRVPYKGSYYPQGSPTWCALLVFVSGTPTLHFFLDLLATRVRGNCKVAQGHAHEV